jgi:hypothetical protein
MMTTRKAADGVEYEVKILGSALKHGITAETIDFVLDNIIFDEMVEDDPAKTLVIGYDKSANLVELVVYEMEENYLLVFHAMACRKEYRKKVFR